MIKIYEIPTPENVHLEYELAGLGSRFIAFFVDTIIQYSLLAIGYIIIIATELEGFESIESLGDLSSYIIAIGLILTFLILYGYYIFFDMIFSGQSPGKKLARIRVIKQNGEAIGFLDSFIRNILRLADFLPAFNLIGVFLIAFTKNYKRLGDFAAHTIVIKLQDNNITAIPNTIDNSTSSKIYDLILQPINNYENDLLKQILEKKNSTDKRYRAITGKLKDFYIKKFNIEDYPFNNEMEFFQEIVKQNSEINK